MNPCPEFWSTTFPARGYTSSTHPIFMSQIVFPKICHIHMNAITYSTGKCQAIFHNYIQFYKHCSFSNKSFIDIIPEMEAKSRCLNKRLFGLMFPLPGIQLFFLVYQNPCYTMHSLRFQQGKQGSPERLRTAQCLYRDSRVRYRKAMF